MLVPAMAAPLPMKLGPGKAAKLGPKPRPCTVKGDPEAPDTCFQIGSIQVMVTNCEVNHQREDISLSLFSVYLPFFKFVEKFSFKKVINSEFYKITTIVHVYHTCINNILCFS